MSEIKVDKKAESIAIMKNANKHLTEVFSEMTKKDIVLQTCASDLAYIARQCGDLRVQVYVANQSQVVSLKTYLETIVANLNGARS